MFLLDTNVVSELGRGSSGRADARVSGWVRGVVEEMLFLSVIAVQELETGVRRAERAGADGGESRGGAGEWAQGWQARQAGGGVAK